MKVLCKNASSFVFLGFESVAWHHCAFFIFDRNNVFCMRNIFKIVQKTLPLLEMAKKRICFHFKAEETMKEGGTKFSNTCGIWKPSSDLGAKSQCVSRGGNSSWKELMKNCVGKAPSTPSKELSITPKGTFVNTKERSSPPKCVFSI